ncbi:MAG: ABC transporter ATP-binding protein [Oscillospiraceae bacterium]|nr:ABC transporter ATP-binding protein [Oscillospiraceae bacterium]
MVLKAEGISRQYLRQFKSRNFFVAVKETDFTLQPGKLTEITGRSGSGKSTLLNMLSGLLEPTTGKVLLDDTDMYALEDEKRSKLRNSAIGVIPQGQTGLHSLTVLENVLLPYTMYGEKGPEDRAMELLEAVGIAGLRDIYPNELSGGEMRRLAVARAMIRQPEIILADEPTGDLDDENTHTVLKLLRKAADEGAAALLVTHEKEAAQYADISYRMNDGVLTME